MSVSLAALAPPASVRGVKALTFDVFGTVVDWRGTIIAEGAALNRARGWKVDWAVFADQWRAGYGPSMNKVRKGELPWTKIDALHRMILDELIARHGLSGLTEDEKDRLNRVWHRLRPWPDSVGGLTRLKKKYVIATLSNGNVSLLTNMAKHAGLPWDCVLSAELARHYKPDPEAYLSAADLLGLKPEQVMMVAAHAADLRAAAKTGMRTAFVSRPLEYGPGGQAESVPADMDLIAKDFLELAAQLGA
jgi:2-haloacid dehalogenase